MPGHTVNEYFDMTSIASSYIMTPPLSNILKQKALIVSPKSLSWCDVITESAPRLGWSTIKYCYHNTTML